MIFTCVCNKVSVKIVRRVSHTSILDGTSCNRLLTEGMSLYCITPRVNFEYIFKKGGDYKLLFCRGQRPPLGSMLCLVIISVYSKFDASKVMYTFKIPDK